ncbi:hypothetical protein [Flexithrix dorotheae]|uniref:hypothetical protein n=1 Tax=Flexithrix dorotheae TaxID=70993 RepID=UPI00036D3C03|nr:hypothetical protein [Flexithrix dorotheae]
MNKHFYDLYSKKTESQLRQILVNKKDYQEEALEAAILVLNEKHGACISIKKKVIEAENTNPIDNTTNPKKRKPFLRTLSFREFYSTICVSLIFYSGIIVFNLYSSEPWYQEVSKYFYITLLLVIIPFIHISYRIEHKRSNDFEGRFYHTFFSFIVGWIIISLLDYLINETYYILSFRLIFKIVLSLLGMAFAVLFFELVYFLLNQLLSLFKWRIW